MRMDRSFAVRNRQADSSGDGLGLVIDYDPKMGVDMVLGRGGKRGIDARHACGSVLLRDAAAHEIIESQKADCSRQNNGNDKRSSFILFHR